ncbi:MAG: sulfocyanin-like copper-binding protein [Acidimicrobiales bacterium]
MERGGPERGRAGAAALVLVLAAPAILAGCGSKAPRADLSSYMTVQRSAHSVTLRLLAGKGGSFNFDGYSNGAMTVTVPLGWEVHVDCVNQGAQRHSCAVVSGKSHVAFPGASTTTPAVGLPPGQQQSFSFQASAAGTYRIACLVPGHEDAGMWAGLVVGPGASPGVVAK